MNHRWLGGTLTNWKTISNSIKRLKDLEDRFDKGEFQGLTKKEQLNLSREKDKLSRSLGGIKDMGGLPSVIIVIDTNREDLAVAEANTLGVPVVGILDSNSDPKGITFPVPGNDDAIRAIKLYCDLIAASVLDGIQQEMTKAGVDLGSSEEAPAEELPAEDAVAEAPAEAAAEEAPAEAPAEEAASSEDPEKPAEEAVA